MISDGIYERSVRKQLHLTGAEGHLFPSYNGDIAASCDGRAMGTVISTSDTLESSLKDIYRAFLCRGAVITDIAAVLGSDTDESLLRQTVNRLQTLAGDLSGTEGTKVTVSSVQILPLGDLAVILTCTGHVLPALEAPWQAAEIYPGEELVLTGTLGASALSELVRVHARDLKKAMPPALFLSIMKKASMKDRLPFVEVSLLSSFLPTAVIPCGEGGIETALMRIGDRKKAGLSVDVRRLSFDQETIEAAEYFNLNPMQMESKGAYLIAVPKSETGHTGAEELVLELRRRGIAAVSIGTVTKEKKRTMIVDDEERYMNL